MNVRLYGLFSLIVEIIFLPNWHVSLLSLVYHFVSYPEDCMWFSEWCVTWGEKLSSLEEVISVRCIGILIARAILDGTCLCGLICSHGLCKVKEMNGSVGLMVEVFGVVEHETVPHVDWEVLPIEIVVPNSSFWHHEEAKELVTQNHLHLLKEVLVVVWNVWLDLSILVLFTPFKALIGELVNTERAWTRGKAASSNDSGLSIPISIVNE